METPQTSPVDYPTIEINGTAYRVKFGLGALYRLEQQGLNTGAFFDSISGGKDKFGAAVAGELMRDGKFVTNLLRILVVTLGREVEGKWVPLRMSVEELADSLSETGLSAVIEAITAARGKASPSPEESQTAAAVETTVLQ